MRTEPGPATILVVDDEAPIRNLARHVLEDRGYQVLVAADSAAAFRVAGAHPSAVQLLLTDIMMPHGNGIALSKAFLAKWPTAQVLYMSGFEAETLALVGTGGAPDGPFLAKPFTPGTLLERVEALVPLQPQEPEAPGQPDPTSPSPGTGTAEHGGALAPTSEAIYRLEGPARCPQCGETIATLKAIRLLRTQVNFISTLPRRGRVVVCPDCLVILPAELTNF